MHGECDTCLIKRNSPNMTCDCLGTALDLDLDRHLFKYASLVEAKNDGLPC